MCLYGSGRSRRPARLEPASAPSPTPSAARTTGAQRRGGRNDGPTRLPREHAPYGGQQGTSAVARKDLGDERAERLCSAHPTPFDPPAGAAGALVELVGYSRHGKESGRAISTPATRPSLPIGGTRPPPANNPAWCPPTRPLLAYAHPAESPTSSSEKGRQDARGAAQGSVVRQEPGQRAAVGLRRILQPHQAAHGTERRRHARKGGRHHKGANLRAARIGNAYWQGQAASGHATPRLLRPLPQGDPVCLVPAPPCGGDPGGRREGVARTLFWVRDARPPARKNYASGTTGCPALPRTRSPTRKTLLGAAAGQLA